MKKVGRIILFLIAIPYLVVKSIKPLWKLFTKGKYSV